MPSFHKNRISDGITVNKVMVVITGSTISLVLAMASWVYTTDREENIANRAIALKHIKVISEKVSDMATNRKLDSAYLINLDTRVVENKEDIKEWKIEVRNYWRQSRL